MAIPTTIANYQAKAQEVSNSIQATGTLKTELQAILDTLKAEILDANTNGAGNVSPGFLIEGMQILTRTISGNNKVQISLYYDSVEDKITNFRFLHESIRIIDLDV